VVAARERNPKSMAKSVWGIPHGVYSTYNNRGCRCKRCKVEDSSSGIHGGSSRATGEETGVHEEEACGQAEYHRIYKRG